MIERVGKEFPTLFICVRERVRPAPRPKAVLVVQRMPRVSEGLGTLVT